MLIIYAAALCLHMQAHIVRALLEAIAFQTRDVLAAMQARELRSSPELLLLLSWLHTLPATSNAPSTATHVSRLLMYDRSKKTCSS